MTANIYGSLREKNISVSSISQIQTHGVVILFMIRLFQLIIVAEL